MGAYINNIGTSFDEKVKNLKDLHNATETDSTFKKNLVCVVDNGFFAAAAWAFSESERNEFEGSIRRKTWLVVPNVEKLID